jgi:glycosyltransferase involved in cell wall biosynthesis
MRILYHHRTRSEDAQGVHIYEMITAFRELGHEVDVVALVRGDGAPARTRGALVWKYIRRCAPTWFYELLALFYNAYGYRRLVAAIRAKRPDFIYERYALNTFCGVWASRKFAIPLVLEVNAPLFLEQQALGRLAFASIARFSERWVCSHSTWTIAVSHTLKALLVQEGVPGDRVVVIPNGVDARKFHPAVSGAPVRRRYDLGDAPVVGFIGWFRPWHGLEMLVQAMHLSGLFNRGVRLLLAGDGPAYTSLHAYAEQHALLPAVVFSGPVRHEEVPAHIAAIDIAVQPSATEYACPMKLLEYMAMARCIVAPDQPNVREVLPDRSALYFEVGNRESLARALQEALSDPARREAVGRMALDTVHDRELLWHANARRVLGLVGSLSLGALGDAARAGRRVSSA